MLGRGVRSPCLPGGHGCGTGTRALCGMKRVFLAGIIGVYLSSSVASVLRQRQQCHPSWLCLCDRWCLCSVRVTVDALCLGILWP